MNIFPTKNFGMDMLIYGKTVSINLRFQAPLFIKSLVPMLKDPPVVLRGYRDEKLIGATFFTSGTVNFSS